MQGIDGQLTIFDIMAAEPDFETMSTKAAVQLIQERTGLKFEHHEGFHNYFAKKKGYKVEINGFKHYARGVRDERRYLDMGISKGTWGSGRPIESIDEAVKYIQNTLSKCQYSNHTCNKEELWKVAETLDDPFCPHVCCRKCNTKGCGARCNGSEEPKEYFGLWIERQELCNRSDNTIDKYQSDYKRFIEGKEFELLKIDEITDEDIARLLKNVSADKKYTFKALQSLFGYIKGVMDKAVRDKAINENPCKYVDLEMFKKNCKEEEYHSDEERTLSDEERKILNDKLQQKHITKPYYMPAYAVELSTLTGMRVGEITGLKWEDVFWDKKIILIRHSEKYNRRTKEYTVEDTKNFKHRAFPITDEIEKILKLVWKRESEKGWLTEYVFADETGHIHSNKVSSAMRNYTLYDDRFEYAKSIHANRRTINSNMRCAGVSAVVTSSLLGNTVQCNTNNYTYDTTEAEYKAQVVTKANAL